MLLFAAHAASLPCEYPYIGDLGDRHEPNRRFGATSSRRHRKRALSVRLMNR